MEAIQDARDWRYHDEPPWLQPVWKAAVELGVWLGEIKWET
jgi:hypothetical protein